MNPATVDVFSATRSDRIDFKFYDLLEQILDKQPSTSASAVETDAIEISEDSEGEGGNDTGKNKFIAANLRSTGRDFEVRTRPTKSC